MSISIESLTKILLNEWLLGQFQVFLDILGYFVGANGRVSHANALSLRANQRKRHWRFLDTQSGRSGA